MLMAPENNTDPKKIDPSNDNPAVNSPNADDFSFRPAPASSASQAEPTPPLPIGVPTAAKPVDEAPSIIPTPTPTPVQIPSPAAVEAPKTITPAVTPITTAKIPMPTLGTPNSPSQKPKLTLKKKLIYATTAVVLLAALSGAYLYGRHNERVVIRPPALKPINLPPQAIVLSNCVTGRGKQYIIPKDIPEGPIYDVENSKVIAIEYNLDLAQVETNPDSFSNTILELTKDYPVDHFSLVPATPVAGQSLSNIDLIMFVVSKAASNSITCPSTSSTSASSTT
jgi:hypothetical protein